MGEGEIIELFLRCDVAHGCQQRFWVSDAVIIYLAWWNEN